MTDSSSRTPSRNQVDKLSQANQSVVAQAQSELDKVFETVINMYDDPADQRDALLELVPAIARKYGNIDSVAAAEWYEKVRHKWIIDDDYTVDSRYDPDDVPMRKTVRRLAGHLWDDGKKRPRPRLRRRETRAARQHGQLGKGRWSRDHHARLQTRPVEAPVRTSTVRCEDVRVLRHARLPWLCLR